MFVTNCLRSSAVLKTRGLVSAISFFKSCMGHHVKFWKNSLGNIYDIIVWLDIFKMQHSVDLEIKLFSAL